MLNWKIKKKRPYDQWQLLQAPKDILYAIADVSMHLNKHKVLTLLCGDQLDNITVQDEKRKSLEEKLQRLLYTVEKAREEKIRMEIGVWLVQNS